MPLSVVKYKKVKQYYRLKLDYLCFCVSRKIGNKWIIIVHFSNIIEFRIAVNI